MYFEGFVSNFLGGLFVGECLHPCLGFKSKRTAHMKFYEEGYKNIMQELDITKLIKSIKNTRAMIKLKFKDDPDFIKLNFYRKNVIYLDESPDSHDSGAET